MDPHAVVGDRSFFDGQYQERNAPVEFRPAPEPAPVKPPGQAAVDRRQEPGGLACIDAGLERKIW